MADQAIRYLLDVVFGTYAFPDERPAAFGLADGEVLEGFGAVLRYPLTYLSLGSRLRSLPHV